MYKFLPNVQEIVDNSIQFLTQVVFPKYFQKFIIKETPEMPNLQRSQSGG